MNYKVAKTGIIVFVSLVLSIGLFIFSPKILFLEKIDLKIYDTLCKAEYSLSPYPFPVTDKITLVTVDNYTIRNMPTRWPYPRTDFAKVIENLKKNGARVIAFDFMFMGQTDSAGDAALSEAIESKETDSSALADSNASLKSGRPGQAKLVLASYIDEEGHLSFSTAPGLGDKPLYGVVTKIQDKDGIVRKNLTHLVSENKKEKGFCSWEMQILRAGERIDLSSFKNHGDYVTFKSKSEKKWQVPVDRVSGSFIIHFRAHTKDFNRLSFYKVLNNEFRSGEVKDKIILIGLTSNMFADIHNTPISWLPGLTLNANALLTLIDRDFIRILPRWLCFVVMFLAVIFSSLSISRLHVIQWRAAALSMLLVFYIISYILLKLNVTWDYTLLPLAVILAPLLGRRVFAIFIRYFK